MDNHDRPPFWSRCNHVQKEMIKESINQVKPMTTATLTRPATASLNLVRVLQPEGIFGGTQGAVTCAEAEMLIQAQVRALVIDFTQTIFIDSSGLRSLLLILESTKAAGIPLHLCGLNAQCQMIFELTRADEVFEMVPDTAALPYASEEMAA